MSTQVFVQSRDCAWQLLRRVYSFALQLLHDHVLEHVRNDLVDATKGRRFGDCLERIIDRVQNRVRSYINENVRMPLLRDNAVRLLVGGD